jgi:hypothetical protein
MSALTLMLIRHAEKPDEPPTPELGPGLNEQGAQDAHSLVIRGWQRAGTWAALFGSGVLGADFPMPGVVYAANPDKPSTVDGVVSRRPYETILPLCQKLHVTPITKYGVGEEGPMLDRVRQLTGIVLVAWEHKQIGKAILPELAKGQRLPNLPAKWDGSRFDVVLRFDRAQSGAQWSFRQLFPRLLAGDSDIPM